MLGGAAGVAGQAPHLGGQAWLRDTPGIRWLGPFAYLGVQCALLLGFWFGAWAAALVFGSAQALQINLQFFRNLIPPQWAFLQNSYVVGLAPYILTMLILTGLIGRTIPPAADGLRRLADVRL